jgi:hypothetical protein
MGILWVIKSRSLVGDRWKEDTVNVFGVEEDGSRILFRNVGIHIQYIHDVIIPKNPVNVNEMLHLMSTLITNFL